jgi:hypothetical protein
MMYNILAIWFLSVSFNFRAVFASNCLKICHEQICKQNFDSKYINTNEISLLPDVYTTLLSYLPVLTSSWVQTHDLAIFNQCNTN